MPRLARNRSWASGSPANRLHHVTNRGVDRSNLFRSPVDRFVFLSILAAVCLDGGLRIHAFCLMTNHFHLLVEDPRGVLSHAMLRLQTAYARYVRDINGRRGSGHVFGDRFFSRAIGDALDYRRVVDYILRNPLECAEPLAATAEGYLWSSAAAHVAEDSAAEWITKLVASFGGVDALLASLPEPKTKQLELARLHRMACLVGGEWLDVEAARCGRTGEQLSAAILFKANAVVDSVRDDGEDHGLEGGQVEMPPAPRTRPAFTGHKGALVMEALDRLTEDRSANADVVAYALWRFAKEGRRHLARAVIGTVDQFARSVQRIASLRLRNPAIHEALSRLEWRMTFALGGGPWRT